MKLLLITACVPQTTDCLLKKICSFATVHTSYSPFYSMPSANFSFGLRFDTMDQIPWSNYDGIVVCGGSRITSLATECAYSVGVPIVIFHAPTQSLWVQSPSGGIINISQQLYSASLATVPLEHIDLLSPTLFDKPTSSLIGSSITLGNQQYFRTGQYCDLVSVACSEDTSSVTASDIALSDIRLLSETIQQSGLASLQRISNLFAEFQWHDKRMMIYRQGRLSLSPCENAEEVFFAYQFFVNS